jgi:prolipoprotein diacylglyceryltransferase
MIIITFNEVEIISLSYYCYINKEVIIPIVPLFMSYAIIYSIVRVAVEEFKLHTNCLHPV